MTRHLSLALLLALAVYHTDAQTAANARRLAIIGYYAGRNTTIDSFPMNELTNVIYSFCHLRGNRLWVNNSGDSDRIRHLVALKVQNPSLKVILSMGGWGGCRTCPDVFATDSGRSEFAASARELSDYFHTDGIDLDWEYPGLENVPGYPYTPEDRDHFTDVLRKLRSALGRKAEISFAAGGFTEYLQTSVDWKRVAPLVNYINLMTYDLVGGYSRQTGHHTPLYSTPEQTESTDHAVRWLDSAGVPLRKLVIGMAFYARIYQVDDTANYGLYRPAHFWRGVSYRDQATLLSPDSGYVYHWDSTAQAPWLFNAQRRQFVTLDDTTSIRLKTEYAIRKGLGGVMFWQMADDNYFSNGLLDVIYHTRASMKKASNIQ
ncbi:MAG TPA: glycosyl hydrolase family 18 protein [Puia sp.]|nr:glycosyl hydrolase family 18 protein [Puia sp.]